MSCCYICGEILGDVSRDMFVSLFPESEYVRRVVFESDNFVLIPSIGPIVIGHMLLCPRNHLYSIGEVSPHEWEELLSFKALTTSAVQERFGRRTICFEHGSTRNGSSPGCSIYHAHMHILPIGLDIFPKIQKEFPWQEVDSSLSTLRDYANAGIGYLYYEGLDSKGHVAPLPNGIPSQWMRHQLANEMGRPGEWDWRIHPNVESIEATLRPFGV